MSNLPWKSTSQISSAVPCSNFCTAFIEQVKELAKNLLDHAMNHPWVDDDLRNSIVCNICREHKLVPPVAMDTEGEWEH